MTTKCTLRNNKEEILRKWEALSKSRFPSAADKTRASMRDHLPELIDALCEVIETNVFEEPKEISEIHGRQRFSFGDYTLSQVISEYSILKNLIFDELDSADLKTRQTLRLIDLFFDSAITSASTEFSRLREEELKTSSFLLEESVRDLERFTGVAAHDLRSPAGTIVGYCDLMMESLVGDSEMLRSTQTINRTAKRMISLIDQLLVYTRIGKSEMQFSEFLFSESIDNAISNCENLIRDAHAQIHKSVSHSMCGDEILMTQLFQNLLANSLKFRSQSRVCEIWITVKLVEDNYIVEFKDNGLGFSPALSEMIFEPFKRAHEHSKIQGSGIGLATVERIVKLHHGSISAEGKEGIGAKFTIQIPALLEKLSK